MTIKTEDLISSLASQSPTVKQLEKPAFIALKIIAVLAIYCVVVATALGIRQDLALQFSRLLFSSEIISLLAIIITSVLGCSFMLFPDFHQNKYALYFPLYSLALFVFILAIQFFIAADARMVIAAANKHAVECTTCIAGVAIVPSALIFAFLKKGRSFYPSLSGVYTILASSGAGCLMLRLAEQTDSITHLVIWHYIPILFFASVGAFAGKVFLKW